MYGASLVSQAPHSTGGNAFRSGGGRYFQNIRHRIRLATRLTERRRACRFGTKAGHVSSTADWR
eukprot:4757587-Prymnesium_polylepis.4